MKIVSLLPLAAMLLGASAMAGVNKCVDAKGHVTYTETACGKETVQQQSVNITPPSPQRASAAAPAAKNWEAENAAFRLRQAERDAAEATANRAPAASAPTPEPTDQPRHIIRRQNQPATNPPNLPNPPKPPK